MDDFAQTDKLVALSNATLGELPANVERPRYVRPALTPGIVHVGLGNFHRAHQSWYLHRLMQDGRDHDFAIIGAGVRAYDSEMRDRLVGQDCLTTLIELDPSGTSAEVVGSMIDYLPVEDGNGPLIAAMTSPEIRIVSLTVTEGGYFVTADGGFDADHEDIQHDAAHPQTPKTAFGAMIEALRLRRAAGVGPFTAQSCDNLLNNGGILRQTLVSLARLSDADLAAWIDANCSFPNSMVDCIVPATGADELRLVRDLGINDAAPVTHENFRQWVIEDDFCAGRPAWETVGVTLTDKVHDYETMKLRCLNASHQVVANPGELLGLTTIADCMEDPEIMAFFRKIQTDEITPYVKAVPEISPQDYAKLVEARYANREIKDTVRRVAFDGSSRHTGFVIPIIRDALAAGGLVEGLALTEALWARMCAGTRDDGSAIEANDPVWNDLVAAADQARTRPAAWLEQSRFYGDLVDDARFAKAFERRLSAIWADGTRAALKAYAAG